LKFTNGVLFVLKVIISISYRLFLFSLVFPIFGFAQVNGEIKTPVSQVVKLGELNPSEQSLFQVIDSKINDNQKAREISRLITSGEDALSENLLLYIFSQEKYQKLLTQKKLTTKDSVIKDNPIYIYNLVKNGISNTLFKVLASSAWGQKLLSAENRYGSTPIHYQAINHGLTDNMFKELASSAWGQKLLSAENRYGYTPIRYQATNHGLTDNMFKVLASSAWGQELLSVKNYNGLTPIHYQAEKHGLTEYMFKELASSAWGQKLLSIKNNSEFTPIHYQARMHGLTEYMFKVLASSAWGQKLLSTENEDGYTPIFYQAEKHGLTEYMFKVLARSTCGQKIFSTKKNRYGYTPIHNQARKHGLTEYFFNELASSAWGQKLLSNEDTTRSTPIHYQAEKHGLTEYMFNMLVCSDWGQELLSADNKYGHTPIHYQAGSHGLTDNMFKVLVSSDWGQKLLSVENKYGHTPIHYQAKKYGLTEGMFTELLGSAWGQKLLAIKDADGNTFGHFLKQPPSLPMNLFLKLVKTQKGIDYLLDFNNKGLSLFEHIYSFDLLETLNSFYVASPQRYKVFVEQIKAKYKDLPLGEEISAINKYIPIKIAKDMYDGFSKQSPEMSKWFSEFEDSTYIFKIYLNHHLGQDSLQRSTVPAMRNLEAHKLHRDLAIKIIKQNSDEFVPYFLGLLKTRPDIDNSNKELIVEFFKHGVSSGLISFADLLSIVKLNSHNYIKELALRAMESFQLNQIEIALLQKYISNLNNLELKSVAEKVYGNQTIVEVKVLLQLLANIEDLSQLSIKSNKEKYEVDDKFFEYSYAYINKLSELSGEKKFIFEKHLEEYLVRVNEKLAGLTLTKFERSLYQDLKKLLAKDEKMFETIIDVQSDH